MIAVPSNEVSAALLYLHCVTKILADDVKEMKDREDNVLWFNAGNSSKKLFDAANVNEELHSSSTT